MKQVLVIYEGAVDAPCDELEGTTPLGLARNVNASALAKRGQSGCLLWQETGDVVSRTEHALALLLGVKPAEAKLLRRGPVEAAAIVDRETSWTYAYRGNLAALDESLIRENRVDGLTLDETTILAGMLREKFSGQPVSIEILAPARLLVLFDQMQGKVDPGSFPENGMDTGIKTDSEPQNGRERFMADAGRALAAHSINEVRVDLGENPASGIWLWGGGTPASASAPFLGKRIKAAMVTNSPLARGMGALCGMRLYDLGNPWSEQPHPEIISKDDLADCIARHDLTVIYVEAPLEGGCFGEPVEKVKAMDRLDVFVLGRLLEAIADFPDSRIMLTTVPEEGVEFDFSPVVLSGPNVAPDQHNRWQEDACENGGLGKFAAEHCFSVLLGE